MFSFFAYQLFDIPLWLAIALVIYFATSPARYALALLVIALVVVVLHVVLPGAASGTVPAVVDLIVVTLAGWGIRTRLAPQPRRRGFQS